MFKNPKRHFWRDFPEFQPPQTFPLKFFWFGPRGVTGFPSFPAKDLGPISGIWLATTTPRNCSWFFSSKSQGGGPKKTLRSTQGPITHVSSYAFTPVTHLFLAIHKGYFTSFSNYHRGGLPCGIHGYIYVHAELGLYGKNYQANIPVPGILWESKRKSLIQYKCVHLDLNVDQRCISN